MQHSLNLPKQEWEQLEEIISRFEVALQNNESPTINEYQEHPGINQRVLLWELVHVELESHLKSGESVRVEDYLQRFPQLSEDLLHLKELVTSEFVLRHRLEPELEIQEYQQRFPDFDKDFFVALKKASEKDHQEEKLIADQQQTMIFSPGSPELNLDQSVAKAPQRQYFGRYELKERLGKGAFGSVYRAYDTQMKREVALKIPHQEALNNQDELKRFFREARAVAQLEHPNIVPIYDSGMIEETPYIASAFIAGQSLQELIESGTPLSTKEISALVRQLAEALHYAHNKGIIHRDIKPGNILLDANGVPHIIDLGLARREQGESLLTQEGTQMGTPAYMSPEQASGNSHLADAQSDLWSLGVILYELLTGQRPFTGTLRELLPAIINADPKSLRTINVSVPKDLESICLKCLTKEPSKRFASCQHLADELERWENRLPIQTRPPGLLGRIGRWSARNRLAAATVATLSICLITFTVYQLTRPAYLDLRVSPSDARVLLDDQPVMLQEGQAIVAWKPGPFSLEISADQYESQQQRILLVRGRDNAARVAIELKPNFGYLSLSTSPDGVNIEIVDQEGVSIVKGASPFHSPRLPAGSYSIKMKKNLYQPFETKVTIPNGDRVVQISDIELKPAVEGSDSLARLEKILALLDRPLSKNWQRQRMPLSDFMADLSKAERITILINSNSLAEEGLTPREPVYTSLKDVSLKQALTQTLSPLGLTYRPSLDKKSNLSLQIMSRNKARNYYSTVLFPVGDLVESQSSASAEVQALADSIRRNTGAQWLAINGKGGQLNFLPKFGALSVIQTWSGQAEVHAYLKQLRQTSLSQTKQKSSSEITNSSQQQNREVKKRPQKSIVWNDSAIPPAWAELSQEHKTEIQSAHGLVHDRFIWCLDLPWKTFLNMKSGLRTSYYRPLRVRPYLKQGSLFVAIVCTRDGHPWELLSAATSQEILNRNAELKPKGWIPTDVAGYLDQQEKYIAVWEKNAELEVHIDIGLTKSEHRTNFGKLKKENWHQHTHQMFLGKEVRISNLWHENIKSTPRWGSWYGGTAFYKSKQGLFSYQSDTSITTYENSIYVMFAGCWIDHPELTSTDLCELDLKGHLNEARHLMKLGYRPAAIDANSLGDEIVSASVWYCPK